MKKMLNKSDRKLIAEIRSAFAEYIRTEGCSCCSDTDGHEKAMNQMGKLLKMKKYADRSGYDYSKYLPKPKIK